MNDTSQSKMKCDAKRLRTLIYVRAVCHINRNDQRFAAAVETRELMLMEKLYGVAKDGGAPICLWSAAILGGIEARTVLASALEPLISILLLSLINNLAIDKFSAKCKNGVTIAKRHCRSGNRMQSCH